MWPHERSLVKRLQGKPFALIGVNTVASVEKNLQGVMEKEKLTWRSFADDGTIRHRWNLQGTPTLYFLDHKGVIRHKWLGSPGEKAIDAALERLIDKAERDAKNKPK